MTGQVMLDLLTTRLEDPNKKITDTFKLGCLDDAQILTAILSNHEFLTELQYISDTALSVSSSKVALTGLTYNILGAEAGILNVKNNTNSAYATAVTLKEYIKAHGSYLLTSATNPKYLVFSNAIYPFPSTITALDVHYIKIPNPLRHAFTIASGSTATFTASGSQNLSTTADIYNGTPIYNITEKTYHIVTDYGTSLDFTVSPAATSWSGDTFRFVTGGFELINLSAVTCELNSVLHEVVVAFALAECWRSVNKLDRASTALASAIGMLQDITGQYIAPGVND